MLQRDLGKIHWTDNNRHWDWTSYKNLFNKLDASQQVHAEINESPVNTLFLVFFLFKNEHVMVEELLQLFVGEVNTQLFKAVELWFYVKEYTSRLII